MFTCTVCKHMYTHACEGLSLLTGFFVDRFLMYLLEQSPWLKLALAYSDGHLALWIPCLYFLVRNFTRQLTHQADFLYRCWELKLGSSCLCSRLISYCEPSPQLLNISLKYFSPQFSMNNLILHLKTMSEWIKFGNFLELQHLWRINVYHWFIDIKYPLICLRQLILFLYMMVCLCLCWFLKNLFLYQRGWYSVT